MRITIMLFLFLSVSSWAVDSYKVFNGTPLEIDEHSVCKEITYTGALGAILVPTKTAAEWSGASGFLSNLPPSTTATNCLVCGDGQYKPASTCVNVGSSYYSPAGDNSRYACPSFRYTLGSGTGANANADCLATTDYYGANTATSAVTVGTGYYSPYRDNTRYTCTNLPANACSTTYSGSGNGANNCPISTPSCNLDYYRSGTSCVACGTGKYKSGCTTGTSCSNCTNTVTGSCSVTYSGSGGGANNCPISTVSCTTDYYKSGVTCIACGTGKYKSGCSTATSCSNCTNKPANSCSTTYTGSGGGTNNCPIGTPSCNAGYKVSGTSCVACGVGEYKSTCTTSTTCSACTNKPANSHYTGSGGATNTCAWACDAGYTESGGSCISSKTWSIQSTEGCGDVLGRPCTTADHDCPSTVGVPPSGSCTTPPATCTMYYSASQFKVYVCN